MAPTFSFQWNKEILNNNNHHNHSNSHDNEMVVKRKPLTKKQAHTHTKKKRTQHATQNSEVNEIHAETAQVKNDNNNDLT